MKSPRSNNATRPKIECRKIQRVMVTLAGRATYSSWTTQITLLLRSRIRHGKKKGESLEPLQNRLRRSLTIFMKR